MDQGRALASRVPSGISALGRLLRSRVVVVYLMGPVAFGVLCALRAEGLVADLAVWVYAAVWIGPALAATGASLLYDRRPSTAALHARAAMDALSVTLVVYATGWGPVLGVTYMVVAQHLVAAVGPKAWRVCRFWALAGIAGGQVAIALGWAPTLLPGRIGNGAAGLAVLAYLFISKITASVDADRQKAWSAVQVSEERLQTLVHGSSDAILVLDGRGNATFASGAASRIFGMPRDRVSGMELGTLVHPDDLVRAGTWFAGAAGRAEPTDPIGLRVRDAGGGWRHLEAVGVDLHANPAVGGFLVNVRDVTERVKAEEELRFQAAHDPLTALPNRRRVVELIAQALEHARRGAGRVAVVAMDLDRFKLINHGRGHPVGDQVLVEVARRLERVASGAGTVARTGSDEFVMLLEEVPGEAAVQTAARRVASALEEKFCSSGGDLALSVSQGIAVAGPGESAEDLLARADAAMYAAKDQGRARIVVADDGVVNHAAGRLDLEMALRAALERDELVLHYQPVVDLATGALVGAEALLRWRHPERGLVGPVDFIEAAEESGLIVPIGEWVLTQATSDAAGWAAVAEEAGAPAPSVAVNISPVQLAAATLPFFVARRLRSVGTDPGKLRLEVTEGVLIQNLDRAVSTLGALRRLGVRIDVDDFGTGYSSLGYLQRLPIDALKIDRSFVSCIGEGSDDSIVASVLSLASSLNLEVVAEGVETRQQIAYLRELSCPLAQGFFFARPMPNEQFVRLLTAELSRAFDSGPALAAGAASNSTAAQGF